jgi:hypothetical protein
VSRPPKGCLDKAVSQAAALGTAEGGDVVGCAHSGVGAGRRAALARLEHRFGAVWRIRYEAVGWSLSRRDGSGLMPALKAPDELQAAMLMAGQDMLCRHIPGALAAADGQARLLRGAEARAREQSTGRQMANEQVWD